MLFNTLAYAKFFAIVFIASWLLVRRASVVWLPWIASLAFWAFATDVASGLETPSWRLPIELGILAAAGVFTAAIAQRAEDPTPQSPPKPRLVLASCLVNFATLAWLGAVHQGADLLSLALGGLGISLPDVGQKNSIVAWALGGLVVAGSSYFLLRARRIRLLFILGASYVFYAHWDWRFLPLIFGSSTIDYWLGRKIGEAQNPIHRKRWLLLTMVVNLGVLAIFKYLNFGIDTAKVALTSLGLDPPDWTLEVALPVGISFFTFESMSYVIDVYRREIPVHRSYLEYLSFVAFFPHLVAGPIVRPRDLLPQLGGKPRFNPSEGSEGLFLIAWGLLKKVAIGDYLAVNLIDRVFDQPIQYSALECYAAVVAYAVQIYCDFSGYTDVAIGSALLLGVRFPLNFNAPYKAADIQDFWRRWHISLSTWLRDYLYIPLGGNRKGSVRTYINLMLTMLLGGLWHGASWTFVVWGGMHGAGLAAHRFLTRRGGKSPQVDPENARGDRSLARYWLSVFMTFHFVCAAWVFFRAPTFGQARILLSQMGQLTTYHPNLPLEVLGVLAVGLLTHFAPERWYHRLRNSFIDLPAPAQGIALCGAAWVLRQMMSAEAVPFVYFQF